MLKSTQACRTVPAAEFPPLRRRATYRLFRIDGLEARFVLDSHHDIETGRAFRVCGNTWRMLHGTRFRAHFDFAGDFSRHFGLFPGCGGSIPFVAGESKGDAGTCC